MRLNGILICSPTSIEVILKSMLAMVMTKTRETLEDMDRPAPRPGPARKGGKVN